MHLDTKRRSGVERLGVYLRRDGLTVMVTLKHEESPRPGQETVDGKVYEEFIAPIPRRINDVPVEIRQWILDREETA